MERIVSDFFGNKSIRIRVIEIGYCIGFIDYLYSVLVGVDVVREIGMI